MNIYNVYNEQKQFVGKLYVGDKLFIEEEKKELSKLIRKILKDGLIVLSAGKRTNDIIQDIGTVVDKINISTFCALENELIRYNYIVEKAPLEEV